MSDHFHLQLQLSCRLLLSAALLTIATAGAAQFAPSPVSASSVTTPVPASGGFSQITSVDVTDSGTIVFAQPQNGQLLTSVNGAAATVLYTLAGGSGGYPKGIAVDHLNNAYISDYTGHLWQVNLTTGAATDILPLCNSVTNSYLGPQTIAVDGQNNVYTAGVRAMGNTAYPILMITQGGTCSSIATGDVNSFVAADGFGNAFYSLGGTNIFEVAGAATGGSSSTLVASGFAQINGLRADATGNLYVSDQSTIDELPYIGGVPSVSASAEFVVLPHSSTNSIGTNSSGIIATSNSSTVSLSTLGALNLGTATSGTTTGSGTLTFYFNAPETVAGFQFMAGAKISSEIVNTGAGTCAAIAYSKGQSCTLTLTMTPSTVGRRQGSAQVLVGTSVVGEATVTTQATGPGLSIDPGTQVALGSGFTSPAGVAADASGNVAVADSAANTVSFIPAGSTTATAIATGLNQPTGIAFGADGSLYIANAGNGSITYVPLSSPGTFGTAVTIANGLTAPSGIALGNDGSVFVADTTSLYRYANNGGTVDFSTRSVLSTSMTSAAGLAVDAAGDVFVADEGAGTIIKFAGQNQSNVVSGLSSPVSVAVEPSGSLLITQNGSSTVLRIPFVSGSYDMNSTSQLGSGFVTPAAVALDGTGNLYVADSTLPGVVGIQRTVVALNLGTFDIGVTSASQSFTLSNSGTASATFGTPLYTASGNSGDFNISTSNAGDCSAGGSLTASSSCAVSATFTPTAIGQRSDTLTFSANALNAASFTETLQGVGTNLPNTTTVLTSSPNPSSLGQSVTFTATVAPVAPATGTATGTVTFKANGTAIGTGTLNNAGVATLSLSTLTAGAQSITAIYGGDSNFVGSTSSALAQTVNKSASTTVLTSSPNPSVSGQSVTFTATVTASGSGTPTGTVTFNNGGTAIGTGTLNNAGVATLSLTTLTVGAQSITATYGGDGNFVTSTSSALTQTVNQGASTASTTALTSSPNPSVSGQSVTFTATVAPVAPATGTPTGTVTFKNSGTAIGTGTLNNAGVATLSLSTLAVGAQSITATYGGDSNFATSTSSALTQTVSSVGSSADFTLTIQPTQATLTSGQTFTTQITLTPLNGLTGSVATTCTGLPTNASCVVTPAQATFSGTTPVFETLTIAIDGGTASLVKPTAPLFSAHVGHLAFLTLPMFGILFLFRFRQQKRRTLLVLAFCALLGGCGGSSTTSATPPGTYTIAVQSQAGTVAHTAQVILTVQ